MEETFVLNVISKEAIVRALINVPNFEIKLRGRKIFFGLGALGMRKTASVARYIQISLYL